MNMECCFRQDTGWVRSAKGEMDRLEVEAWRPNAKPAETDFQRAPFMDNFIDKLAFDNIQEVAFACLSSAFSFFFDGLALAAF